MSRLHKQLSMFLKLPEHKEADDKCNYSWRDPVVGFAQNRSQKNTIANGLFLLGDVMQLKLEFSSWDGSYCAVFLSER